MTRPSCVTSLSRVLPSINKATKKTNLVTDRERAQLPSNAALDEAILTLLLHCLPPTHLFRLPLSSMRSSSMKIFASFEFDELIINDSF